MLRRGEQCPVHPKRDTRPSARKRGYDKAWERIRKQVLAEQPTCELRIHCTGARATVVDHVDGNPFNTQRTNLRASCESCHNARTARDQGRSTPGWVKHQRPAPVFG